MGHKLWTRLLILLIFVISIEELAQCGLGGSLLKTALFSWTVRPSGPFFPCVFSDIKASQNSLQAACKAREPLNDMSLLSGGISVKVVTAHYILIFVSSCRGQS